MQVLDLRERESMQRDMELIREILLVIEKNPQMDGTREFYFNSAEEMGITDHSSDEVAYNLSLLVKARFVEGSESPFLPMMVRTLTWNGHEFLDSIKDKGIWEKTKERIKGLSGVTLGVIAAIAEAEMKKHFGLTP